MWAICNRYGRSNPFGALGALNVSDVLDVCRAYGETVQTFERVLVLEDALYPILAEKAKSSK